MQPRFGCGCDVPDDGNILVLSVEPRPSAQVHERAEKLSHLIEDFLLHSHCLVLVKLRLLLRAIRSASMLDISSRIHGITERILPAATFSNNGRPCSMPLA
eukprot:325962-Rhodomonas_salina.1